MRTCYWSVATALVFSSLLACTSEPSPPGAESAGVPTPAPTTAEAGAGEVKAEAGEEQGQPGVEAGAEAGADEGVDGAESAEAEAVLSKTIRCPVLPSPLMAQRQPPS